MNFIARTRRTRVECYVDCVLTLKIKILQQFYALLRRREGNYPMEFGLAREVSD